ncbi:TetR/AcrR family transcriptional regulator [Nocardia sp. 2]|uniref:TetR/AcrR family transcriptional regulator n=1 Tax=Nocardia acididurans TaxID=2802282 RepID=A0ABS1M201_9NOCA|nr:TetR/AcrR family transcriptional regulator [Nocardia acididurans]MBL1074239.1 TetR/AcrR family transcriptional regulator [Nocardia acididurans]
MPRIVRSGAPKRRYAKRLSPVERREQLLDAALGIVAESGFTAVSIAAVAERSDVTRPVVYDLFGSRDDVLRELIDRETTRMHAAVARSVAAITAETTVVQAVSVGLGRFLAEVRAMPATWRLVYFPIDGVPPLLRERVGRARDELRTPMRRLFSDWLADRPADAAQVDPDVLVQLLQGVIQTLARLVLDDPERYDSERVLALIMPLLSDAPEAF